MSDQKWRRYPDFKIEADASETSLVKSASFSMPVLKGHIKRVAVGKKPIAEIFTPAQMKFLTRIAGHKIDFASLVVLGPLIAQRWRFEDPGCPWPITAELWTRADGKRMMELSIKARAIQAAVAVGGFMAFLAEVGAERDKDQQTKTRWALEYYVSKLAQPAGRKVAAKTKTKRRGGECQPPTPAITQSRPVPTGGGPYSPIASVTSFRNSRRSLSRTGA